MERIKQLNLHETIRGVTIGEEFQENNFTDLLDAIVGKMNGDDSLDEKIIFFNNRARYGQVVFLAGGAGSGKGFASKNFLDVANYKIRDVDEYKLAFQALSKMERYNNYHVIVSRDPSSKDNPKEISGVQVTKNKPRLDYAGSNTEVYLLGDLVLKNQDHVGILHLAIKELGIKNKTLDALLSQRAGRGKNQLPNIVFDITLKDLDDIAEVVPRLIDAGYDSDSIHLVWVLSDFAVAVEQNRNRERVVSSEIMLKTHVGAANTMYNIVRSRGVAGLNGGIYVILGGKDHTVFWTDPDGNVITNTKGEKLVKGFKSLTLKHEGGSWVGEDRVQQQLYRWMIESIPNSPKTAGMWAEISKYLENSDIQEV